MELYTWNQIRYIFTSDWVLKYSAPSNEIFIAFSCIQSFFERVPRSPVVLPLTDVVTPLGCRFNWIRLTPRAHLLHAIMSTYTEDGKSRWIHLRGVVFDTIHKAVADDLW